MSAFHRAPSIRVTGYGKGCKTIDNKFDVWTWRRVSPRSNATSGYRGVNVYRGGRWWVAVAAAVKAKRNGGRVKIEWHY